jgi:type I restriction enzyme M protein
MTFSAMPTNILMRHFATESGKSKGQFYTPAEVSRIMAQIIGIKQAKTTARYTVYDPTCGSGSLLLKVGDEAKTPVTLYGQEKDAATSGLARMNMILHDNPTALIKQGNTLTDPKFLYGEALKTFDYVVANPPFSDKRWSTGIDPLTIRFGVSIVRRAARQAGRLRLSAAHHPLAQKHGQRRVHSAARRAVSRQCRSRHPPQPHPQGLHQGHHRPARQPVLRHGHPRLHHRHRQGKCAKPQGHFHDRRQRGLHEGRPKNRLRAQDIHKIVDVFNKQIEIPATKWYRSI